MNISYRLTGVLMALILMFSPLLQTVPFAFAAEFVTNGTFTTDLSGWTLSGGSAPVWSSINLNTIRFTGTSGTMGSNGSASQVLTNLVTGSTYTVSFKVTGTPLQGFAEVVIIDGVQVHETSGVKNATAAGATYSYTFVAPSDTVTIKLYAQGTPASLIYLDNISVDGAVFTNSNPVFTSPATFSVAENASAVVGTIAASDDVGQTVSYSISGGVDAAEFSIDSVTGELTFNSVPDFESPTDSNGDNQYIVQVMATDDYSVPASSIQNIGITVTDVSLTMTAASTGDLDLDGQIDALLVSFNMDLNGSSVNPSGSDFDVTGYVVASASETAPGVVTILLQESGSFDTGAVPPITIASGEIISSTLSTGNESLTLVGVTPADGVSPIVAEVTPVSTPGLNTTPSYTFNSSEAGSFVLGGSCNTSSPLNIVSGDNTIVFTAPNGNYTDCTIVVTDGSGNISAAMDVMDFVVDNQNPTATITQAPGQNDPTNSTPITFAIAFDEAVDMASLVSSDITVTNGTVANMAVLDNQHIIVEVTPSLDGLVLIELPDGGIMDLVGNNNTGTVNTDNSVVYDTLAPSTPTVAPDLKNTSDSGDSNSDDYTNSPTGLLAFTVPSCPVGQSIQMHVGVGVPNGVTVPCVGTAVDTSISLGPTVNGNFNYTYTLIDAAGNESAFSPSLAVVVDNAAPSAPIFTSITNDTGALTSDWITKDTTLFYSGVVAATGATHVRAWRGPTEIDYVPVAGSSWVMDETAVSMVDGSYSITAKAYDLAGNESSLATKVLKIDNLAPGITSVSLDTPTLSLGDLTQQVEVVYSESMDTNFVPVVTLDANVHFSSTPGVWSNANTTYTQTFTHDGTAEEINTQAVNVASGAIDIAGNIEVAGASTSFTIDTQAPIVPGIPDLNAADDSNINNDDVTNDTTPGFTGSCTGSDIVYLYVDSAPTAINVFCSGGTTYSGALGPVQALSPDANYDISAVAVDAAGNTSGQSPALTVTVDTTAPSIAIEQAPAQEDPTNTASVTFSVVADEPLDVSTFTVSDLTVGGTATVGVPVVTEVAPNDGTTFEVTVTVTADGTVILDLPANTVTDIAGNSNNVSVSVDNQVTVDTIAPTAPVFVALVAPVGGTPTFSGTAEALATVVVREGLPELCTAVTDGAGTWSCVSTVALTTGSHNVTATAEDVAGNLSGLSASLPFTVATGFSVSTASLTVGENLGTNTFDVVLDIQPVANVVFTVSSSDTVEAVTDVSMLTFTNANWNIPQTVTVTGVDDAEYADDAAIITISVDDAASDAGFAAYADETVTITLTNDDVRSHSGGRRIVREEPTGEVLGVATFNYQRDLYQGLSGEDVTKLQERLTEEGYYAGPIIGSFGPLTRAAVIEYQKAHAITPAAGFVGPLTRAELNKNTGTQMPLTEEQRNAILEQIKEILLAIQELQKQLDAKK